MAGTRGVTNASVRAGSDVGVASLDLGALPAEERDLFFAVLGRDEPLARHAPPEDILGLPDQGRQDYWAVVRYDDVRRISRDAEHFCSGQGTQFADAPPE